MLPLSVIDLAQPDSFPLVSQPAALSRGPFLPAPTEFHESVCKQTTLTPAFTSLTKTRPNCTKIVQITPLESALTDAAPVTPLDSALTKKGGGRQLWLTTFPEKGDSQLFRFLD